MTGRPLDHEVTTCAAVEERELLEQYVAGGLTGLEREALEAHVFACDRCADTLQTLLTVRDELAGSGPGNARLGNMRGVLVALLAAAAVLVVGLVTWRIMRPARIEAPSIIAHRPADTPPPPPGRSGGSGNAAVIALARIDPPPYEPLTVRSADARAARFDAAMAAYATHDFAGAAEGLRRVVEDDPSNTAASFYLGVSLLMTGDAAGARQQFASVIDAGDSPFRQTSELFLAKSLLQAGDVAGASLVLERAARGTGPRAREAERLLHDLRALGSRH